MKNLVWLISTRFANIGNSIKKLISERSTLFLYCSNFALKKYRLLAVRLTFLEYQLFSI